MARMEAYTSYGTNGGLPFMVYRRRSMESDEIYFNAINIFIITDNLRNYQRLWCVVDL